MTWTVTDLWRRLVDLDETERVEAKRGFGSSVRDTISAMANEPDMGGGWLLFGVVKEPDGLWRAVGVDDSDRVQSEVATLCRSAFNRPIRPEIRVDRVELLQQRHGRVNAMDRRRG